MADRLDRRQRGAALVEMAIVAPLLILLFFGIIEGSWAYAQANDVRHGAREGARLAAVDFGDAATIAAEVCDRMDLKTTPENVTVAFSGFDGAGVRGDTATITVRQTYDSVTGVLDPFFQGRVIGSSIEFRVERPLTGSASWWGDTTVRPCS